MSSPSTQNDPNKSDRANPSHNGALNRTSIALICAFVLCFSFFIYLSSRAPRISEPVRAAASRPRRNAPRRPKPKLWDVLLDRIGDPHHELKPLGAAVCNWHPLAAWSDDDDDPALAVSRQGHLHPDMLMSPHVAIAQAWFRGAYAFHPERSTADEFPAPTPPALPSPSDPRMLKLAILVAMPSRRKFAPPDPESPPRASIGSGLSYNEGQLLMGVTSVPCEEQAIGVALTEHERTL